MKLTHNANGQVELLQQGVVDAINLLLIGAMPLQKLGTFTPLPLQVFQKSPCFHCTFLYCYASAEAKSEKDSWTERLPTWKNEQECTALTRRWPI